MIKSTLLLAAAVAALGVSAADAAVDIYVSQNATGVFVQALGSLNLTGLTQTAQATGSDTLRGDPGFLFVGTPNQTLRGYTGFTGPTTFGATYFYYANSGAGTGFGLNLGFDPIRFFVPEGYVSGSAIDGSATYLGNTLAGMELPLNTYVFLSSNDTITLHIGEAAPAAVPEPASWAMMVGGFGLLGTALRRRTKVTFAKA